MNVNDSFVEFNDFVDSGGSLVVFHQNICSIRENFNSFLIHFDCLNIKPDILVFTEIWIHTCELGLYKIKGYNQYAYCNDSYRSGGVLVYVSERFVAGSSAVDLSSADALKVTLELGHSTTTATRSLSLTIVAVYRLHSQSVNSFLDEISVLFDSLKDSNVMFIGDMNLCILKQTNITDTYLSIMASNGFEQLINSPTRGNSCLDHVFLRTGNMFGYTCKVVNSGRSDHNAVVCKLNMNGNPGCNSNYESRNQIKFDYVLLRVLLENTDWSSVYQQDDVSIGFEMFLDIFNRCLSEASYIVTCSSKVKFLKPWMTLDICKRQIFRNSLYKKLKTRSKDKKFQRFYNSFTDKLRCDIKNRKKAYYNSLFENNKRDVKKQWKTINSILGKTSKNNVINCINSKSNPGDTINNELCIANEFNNFFMSVTEQLMSSADSQNEFHASGCNEYFPSKRIEHSFFCFPVYKEEIEKCVSKLANNKAPGIDGVSTTSLKASITAVSPVLSFLFNLSFETGIFPTSLKTALVIPIHKKGSTLDPNNYRPISLLSVFSKMLEKLMKERLLKFFSLHNFLCENQFGFMEGKSTEDALLNFCSKIFKGINNKECVSGIFIDITKAFDTVNHDILINRLCLAGIRGIPLNWFRSYLSGRSQCVKVGNSKSLLKPIICGVPQGSVLGPILFLVYINNLCDGRFLGSLTCFADDTALSYSAKNYFLLEKQMQHDMNRLKHWFVESKMILSVKTKLIRFSLRNRNNALDVYFKCSSCLANGNVLCEKCIRIEQVKSIKYLGVTIDENCCWKEHVSKLKTYLNSALRQFYFLRQLCPVFVLRTIYFSIIHSKLQYGISCWGGAYFTTIKPLLVSQKKVIKVMTGAKIRDPSFPLFRCLNILPLRYIFIYRVLRIFFIRGGSLRSNSNVYSARLQNLNRYPVPLPKLEAFRRFYTFYAPRIFNILPVEVSSAKSLPMFLSRLRKWLFSMECVEQLF